jgi:hypothetical protein
MWVRIASKYPIAYSPQNLASYRVGHGIGISNNSYESGQNIIDMTLAIDIIQNYLPEDKRMKYKKAARICYSIFCIRIANSLIIKNKKSAIRQIKGAWRMNKSLITLLWIFRFYLMYYTRIKEVKSRFSVKKVEDYPEDLHMNN